MSVLLAFFKWSIYISNLENLEPCSSVLLPRLYLLHATSVPNSKCRDRTVMSVLLAWTQML
jgi:hypothetical protein